jgi:LAO/AO transport system kinase
MAGRISTSDVRALARAATAIENQTPEGRELLDTLPAGAGVVIGITGPPGAGKSSLVDALTREIRKRGKTVGILAVDPTSRVTGGAIMGDRIRMQQHHDDVGVYIRSMATRGAGGGLASATAGLARLLRGAGFDYVLIETVGVGQDEIEIARLADVTVLVLVPGMGDDVQAIKAGIMEIADIYVINKADHAGADRTESELRAEISPAAPLLRTVATQGTGAAELLNAIDGLHAREKKAPAPNHHRQMAVRASEVEAVLDMLKTTLKPGDVLVLEIIAE